MALHQQGKAALEVTPGTSQRYQGWIRRRQTAHIRRRRSVFDAIFFYAAGPVIVADSPVWLVFLINSFPRVSQFYIRNISAQMVGEYGAWGVHRFAGLCTR